MYSEEDKFWIIEMVWEDCMLFEVIEVLYGIFEKEVIVLMWVYFRYKIFKNWWEWVLGWKMKYVSLCLVGVDRGYCFF